MQCTARYVLCSVVLCLFKLGEKVTVRCECGASERGLSVCVSTLCQDALELLKLGKVLALYSLGEIKALERSLEAERKEHEKLKVSRCPYLILSAFLLLSYSFSFHEPHFLTTHYRMTFLN